MPTNRKENIVFGISMCVDYGILLWALLTISIHLGGIRL